MITLQVNDVLHFSEDGHRERLLWLDPAMEGGWFINIDQSSAVPIWHREVELDEFFTAKLAALATDPWAGGGVAITEVQACRRDEAWDAIKPLVQAQPYLFQSQKRAALIDARAEEIGTTRQKLYRLLRRWWQRGMTPNAMTPDYANSGAPGKQKANSATKRGRPVLHGPEGMNIDSAVREIFRDAVTRYYARNKSFDLAACYHECLRFSFSDTVIVEESGRQKITLREPYPTLSQFRYWFVQDNDIFAVERKRRTPRVYDKDSRGILGTSLGEVAGPGSRFQIDATIADVYLVSRFDRRRIVGRPVIYVIIDVFSRMIVGLYVGFEGPSWVGAMMALANAAAPKVEWCRSFGVEIDEAEWPCRCLPSAILADRGEMLAAAADPLVQRLGIRIENAAPYRADWKGIVERRFGLIHASFRPYVPGYVAPDFRERGARDYRLDATLDLDEFTAVIIEFVRHYNTSHVIAGYPRDPAMIADDVLPIPIDLWEWGVQRRTGMQRSFPEELVKLTLLPTDEATVTPQGIRFRGCYYSCARAIEEYWFDKARQTRTWKVPISYEPRLMDTVWLRDPKGREDFVPCQLTERSADMRSKTLWEIDQLHSEDRRQRGEHRTEQLQGKIDLNANIEGIIEKARRKRPEETRSKAERVGSIRVNRAEERDANRSREAFQRPSSSEPPRAGKVLPFRGGRSQHRRITRYRISHVSAVAFQSGAAKMTNDPILPEYRDNPFIARLPPPFSVEEALAKLTDLPAYSDAERQYPAHLRCHCIQRLARYFDPLSRHLSLEQRIGTLIRQGYVGRNPNTTDYLHRLHNNYERVRRRDLGAQVHPVETTASGYSLIGCSGIGKSRSVDRILRLYPQTIEHADPVALVQVAWLKLDCPYKGSAKQLCISFFHEMDRLLGTRFQARHGSGRTALDEMVVHMAEIADRHALGLLVIDEIQHLMQAPGAGRDDLLNFLVTLINRIGLPVMIVGTPAALPLLQGAFRQARRASGAGSAIWEAMREDGDWDAFLERMWSFQWTREHTPLTPEIAAALRDESQGIVDVVIKLYMLVQLQAIQLGELGGRPERIDAGLIRHVARSELKLIAPMIDALRRGDERALRRYDDLTAFAGFVESSLHDAAVRLQPRASTPVPKVSSVDVLGGQEQIPLLSMLEGMGIAGDIAAVLVAEVRAANPGASTLDLVAAVCDRIRQRGPDPTIKPPRPKRLARRDIMANLEDMRTITLGQEDAYAHLKTAGWIRAPLNDAA